MTSRCEVHWRRSSGESSHGRVLSAGALSPCGIELPACCGKRVQQLLTPPLHGQAGGRAQDRRPEVRRPRGSPISQLLTPDLPSAAIPSLPLLGGVVGIERGMLGPLVARGPAGLDGSDAAPAAAGERSAVKAHSDRRGGYLPPDRRDTGAGAHPPSSAASSSPSSAAACLLHVSPPPTSARTCPAHPQAAGNEERAWLSEAADKMAKGTRPLGWKYGEGARMPPPPLLLLLLLTPTK